MKVKIFESIKNKKRFIFVPEESLITDLPKEIQDEIGNSQPIKSITLNENDGPRIALDPQKAIKSIREKGYFIQGAEVKSKIEETK